MFQTVFLNLSNHPAANWPPAQRAEAEALGGQIVDEPFPAVPPDADPEDVAALGDYTLQRILARAPVAAMVQGEFTLTVYLVQALEFRGILCYAATTRRIVENAVVTAGAVEKRSRFEFVRFRRYPTATPPAQPSPAP
jgi:hypothetical protein